MGGGLPPASRLYLYFACNFPIPKISISKMYINSKDSPPYPRALQASTPGNSIEFPTNYRLPFADGKQDRENGSLIGGVEGMNSSLPVMTLHDN
jgi:hypothetical protein